MARSIFKHTLGGALAASMMMTASVERANAGAKEVIGTAMLLCLANPNICPRNKPRPPGRSRLLFEESEPTSSFAPPLLKLLKLLLLSGVVAPLLYKAVRKQRVICPRPEPS